MNTFVVQSSAGPHRDLLKGSREQRLWNDHAIFIDALVEEGFIRLGGPFDDGGALLVVYAEDEAAVRAKLAPDPWYAHGLLKLDSVKHWQIFIDKPARTGN